MASGLDLWELRVGVYATDDDIGRLLEKARDRLQNTAPASLADRFGADESAEPGIEHEDAEPMSIGELYSELPTQWELEHPGLAPGGRAVFELRAAVLTDEGHAEQLLDDLTQLMCPDPQHAGPCPIPWSASKTGAIDDTYRDYLERSYGRLRREHTTQS